MALFRLSVSVISRSSGRSAVAAAAYRSGEDLLNERDGLVHDYSRRSGIEATEIIAPDHAPEWVMDRAALWNAVEHSEKRRDAQTAREVVFSLPHELNAEQRQQLVRDFVCEQFVARGMVADIAHHAPHRKDDDRNHHAHVMLTTREITRDGFGQKDRTWNDKALVQTWREEWEQHLNRTLEREGIEQRVDHRSLTAQRADALEKAEQEIDPDRRKRWEAKAIALDRLPEPKMGAAHAMEKRGIRTALGDTVREIREMREAVQERAVQWVQSVREVGQDLRVKFNEHMKSMMQSRVYAAQEKLAAQLRVREKERLREIQRQQGLQRQRAEQQQRDLVKEQKRSIERDRGPTLSR